MWKASLGVTLDTVGGVVSTLPPSSVGLLSSLQPVTAIMIASKTIFAS
jgi:hypothetical protein